MIFFSLLYAGITLLYFTSYYVLSFFPLLSPSSPFFALPCPALPLSSPFLPHPPLPYPPPLLRGVVESNQ